MHFIFSMFFLISLVSISLSHFLTSCYWYDKQKRVNTDIFLNSYIFLYMLCLWIQLIFMRISYMKLFLVDKMLFLGINLIFDILTAKLNTFEEMLKKKIRNSNVKYIWRTSWKKYILSILKIYIWHTFFKVTKKSLLKSLK